MSTALYRRYRSARFADLIGQEHIAQTLRNEVRAGSLAHAYLFAGIRGTGKTSTARILARAVNCLAPQDGEPDNECASCVEILGGGAVDVLEIDAASNRGIDEMRDLRDKVKFLPASLRRKVYIIDEAHMLTTEAWNAFLKTLEEPPPHVLFVLATTEPHKVPETVRSRVQRFDFRRVDRAAIAAHLVRIAAAEGADVEAAALELIARAAQGSVRDALSLLDQALASGERPVTVATVRRALGLADPAVVRDLLAALAGADAAAALRAVAAAFEAGADARQLLREGSRLARAVELIAVGYPEGAELDADDAPICRELAAAAAPGFWIDVLDRFADAELNLRQPVDARITVELAVLRLVHTQVPLPPAGRVGPASVPPAAPAPAPEPEPEPPPPPSSAQPEPARHPASTTQPPPPSSSQPDPTSATEPASQASSQPEPVRHPTTTTDPPPPVRHLDPTEAAAATPPPDPTSWATLWPALIDVVNRRDRMLAGVLRDCRPVEVTPGRLVIGAPYGFHREQLLNRHTKLVESVSEFAGMPTTVEVSFVGATTPGGDAEGAGSADQAPDSAAQVISVFPGSRITGSRLRDHAVD